MKRFLQVDPVHRAQPSHFVGSMTPSELGKWDSVPDPPAGETHDDVDSAKPGENLHVYRNASVLLPHSWCVNDTPPTGPPTSCKPRKPG